MLDASGPLGHPGIQGPAGPQVNFVADYGKNYLLIASINIYIFHGSKLQFNSLFILLQSSHSQRIPPPKLLSKDLSHETPPKGSLPRNSSQPGSCSPEWNSKDGILSLFGSLPLLFHFSFLFLFPYFFFILSCPFPFVLPCT